MKSSRDCDDFRLLDTPSCMSLQTFLVDALNFYVFWASFIASTFVFPLFSFFNVNTAPITNYNV